MQRAAAARLRLRVDLAALGGEDADGRGVDVREPDPLDAALHEARRVHAPAPRAVVTAGSRRTAARAGTSGASESITRRRGLRWTSLTFARRSSRPSRPSSAMSGASARSRPGWVKSSKTPRRTTRGRASVRSTWRSSCGRVLSISRSYWTPGRARGHARHAAEAAVEVRDHLGRDLRALLVADAHQEDPPARRVHLLLEDVVARARRQAEAAVHAVADEVERRAGCGRPTPAWPGRARVRGA